MSPQLIVVGEIVVLAICLLTLVNCHPVDYDDEWPIYTAETGEIKENQCATNDEIDAACQRCAKKTKSEIAYPWCCQDREDARAWCHDYVNFGLKPKYSQSNH